jgi:hypothetical protein
MPFPRIKLLKEFIVVVRGMKERGGQGRCIIKLFTGSISKLERFSLSVTFILWVRVVAHHLGGTL